MRITRPLAAGGVLAVAVAALVACSPGPADTGPRSLTVAIPLNQFVVTFEPNASAGTFFLPVQPVYDPLVKWDDEEGAIVPWLAEEYEVSDDGYTVSLTLREGITFTDGEPLTAQGVVDAFNYHVNADGYFKAVTAENQPVATATGERTLDIVTKIPSYSDGGLLITLHLYPIVSPAAYDDADRLATEPVGTGPYILEEVVPEVSAHYVRNPDYWNPDAFDFDEITFAVYDDRVAGLNALKSGQVDAAELDYGLAAEAEDAGFTLNVGPSGYTGILIADRAGERFPPLGDVRVRQALNLAFDRATIAEELEHGYGRVSSQPFGSYSREYVEGGDDRYPYDPERARELLAEAGYPDGFTLPLPDVPAGFGAIDYRPVVEQYLGEIGVIVEWVDVDETTQSWLDELQVPAVVYFQAYGNSVGIFGLGISWGRQPVADPEFQEMLALYKTGTPAEHDAVQPKLAEYILDQAWYVPFSHPQVLWATRDGIVAHGSNFPTTLPRFEMFQLED